MKPKIVTIGHHNAGNKALFEALISRNVDVVVVVVVEPPKEETGLSESLLSLDNYKINSPMTLTMRAIDTCAICFDDTMSNNFMHQSPPRAKKHGNNRKQNKRRK